MNKTLLLPQIFFACRTPWYDKEIKEHNGAANIYCADMPRHENENIIAGLEYRKKSVLSALEEKAKSHSAIY